MKKNNFFWVGFSDLMTSMFFIMLVLFIIAVGYLLHVQEGLVSTIEEQNKLLRLEEQFSPLETDESFVYLQDCKKYIVKDLMGVEIFDPTEVVIKEEFLDITFKAGEKIDGLEHSVWMLVYHIWICAYDIVEFSIKPGHESPAYPKGYWPPESTPATEEEWENTINKVDEELERMVKLLEDKSNDLSTPFPWGSGQNLFKEALVIIDHNSYHIAQIVDLRFPFAPVFCFVTVHHYNAFPSFRDSR